MKLFAKHKVRGYKDKSTWADNEITQKFKKLLDTPECRMYSGRRMFRLINKPKLRRILSAAHYPDNFSLPHKPIINQ